MAEEKVLTYKGHPLMRKDNLIYYGSMADPYIVMLQVLETAARSRDRVVKKSEKDGLYAALDVGCVWLERALAGK